MKRKKKWKGIFNLRTRKCLYCRAHVDIESHFEVSGRWDPKKHLIQIQMKWCTEECVTWQLCFSCLLPLMLSLPLSVSQKRRKSEKYFLQCHHYTRTRLPPPKGCSSLDYSAFSSIQFSLSFSRLMPLPNGPAGSGRLCDSCSCYFSATCPPANYV